MHEPPYPLTVAEAISRIRAREASVSAFISTRLDAALQEAVTPRSGPLAGLPYGLKDLWDTAGITTTAASARFRDRVPTVSAPVHQIFEAAGAVLVGKTNASDLGLAIESQSYVGGITKNPHDLRRTAGGSSGGAAAAVADRMIAFDWGSDFGGSIRLPAAYCGIYGLRLSTEAWPMEGHFPVPPEPLRYMNGQGPLTRDLGLMRRLLEVTAPRLRTGRPRGFSLAGATLYAPTGKAAGRWPTFAADVRPALEAAGLRVRDDHGLLPHGQAGFLTKGFYTVHFQEFLDLDEFSLWSGLAAVLSSLVARGRFGDLRFHPRTAEMLLMLAAGRALVFRDRARTVARAQAYRDQVSALWDRGELIVLPTMVHPAPRHGRSMLEPRLPDCVMPGNLVDATGLAVPFGRFPDGLPRSLQLWGPPGSEMILLEVAERLTPRL